MAKSLTSNKAKEILHDKSVHGHPLTDKQRRFFGAIAGGAKPYENGGWLDKYDQEECDSCKKAQLGYKFGKSEDEVRKAVLNKAADVFASNRKPYELPETIKKSGGNSSYVCIRGVCGILTDAGFLPDKYYTNTSFAEQASELGFGSPQTDINLLKPGDIFQHLANKNEQGNYYPSHAEIFKGWNGDKAEFYDYYDLYNWPISKSSGIRKYNRKEIEDRLNRKAKNDQSDYQAQFFSLSGEQNRATKKYPYNLPENELKDYFEKTHAANTTFTAPDPTIDKNSPLYYSSGEDVRQGTREKLAQMFNDKDLDKQLKRELKVSDQDLQKIKPLIYGVVGQESQFDNPRSTAGGLKYMFENMFNPEGKSLGPGQIKLKSITPSVRESFGIKKGGDLQDLKNTYVGLADIISKSANITDKYVNEESHPDLIDKDRFERALYFLNSPGKVKRTDKQNYDKSIQSNSILTNFSEKAMEDAVKRASETKLSMDPGSYPSKVLNRAKELKTNINFEDTSILPEVMVSAKKQENGGWLSKYEQGGLILKKKTKDNYDLKANPNDVQASVGPGFVGAGYDTTGRNYSPAWGGQFQNGGNLEKVLLHKPSENLNYALKKTVTPYKTNQEIKKNTKPVNDPEDINFLFNYRHTAHADPNEENATSVPYEGNKHWNIDRFITDPQFSTGYEKLKSDDNSIEAERRNTLADMFKYQMYQHPEQSKGKSFREAKRFVRNEIDSRVNGPYFQNYIRDELGAYPDNSLDITTYTKNNPFFEAWKGAQTKDTVHAEYRKNPWDDNKVEKISKDYLRNTKKFSRKETKEQIEKWKTESKSMIDNYYKPKSINQTNVGEPIQELAMGGGLPGATGMMYARTQDPAPSNGKYAKKTKASAQNGKEMAFYQQGLDFTPKTISKDGSVIKDDLGQWAHPGEITEINSNEITMEGVPYNVIGISDEGDIKDMKPGKNYKFKGTKVTEYPKGGWLDKYK